MKWGSGRIRNRKFGNKSIASEYHSLNITTPSERAELICGSTNTLWFWWVTGSSAKFGPRIASWKCQSTVAVIVKCSCSRMQVKSKQKPARINKKHILNSFSPPSIVSPLSRFSTRSILFRRAGASRCSTAHELRKRLQHAFPSNQM